MRKNHCFFTFILLFSQLTYNTATSSSGGTPIFVAPTRSKEMLGRDINALSQLLQLARQPERAGAQTTLCARKQLLSQLQQEQARSQQREEKRKQNKQKYATTYPKQ